MATLCPECDPHFYAVCDFCAHYDFNANADGAYTGDGWCRKHERKADPHEGCDEFHCMKVADSKTPNVRGVAPAANPSAE